MSSPGLGQSPTRAVPPASTSLHSIFNKSSGMGADGSIASPSRSKAVRGVLTAGSNDHLGIAANFEAGRAHLPDGHPAKRWALVADFVASHGDRTVHFSGEAFEMLHSLPVKRYVVVTDLALYRIAQTTVDTGIFFDCRLELDALAQLVAQDVAHDAVAGVSGGAEVQLFTRISSTATAVSGTRAAANVHLTSTLNFGCETTRRKAFLLAICVVRPTLSILQKRNVVHTDPSVSGPLNASASLGAASPKRSGTNHAGAAGSPSRATPRFQRLTESQRRRVSETPTQSAHGGLGAPTNDDVASPSAVRPSGVATTPSQSAARPPRYTPAQFRGGSSRQQQQQADGATPAAKAEREPLPHERTPGAHAAQRAVHERDIADAEFLAAQAALRESLAATTLDGTTTRAYDFDEAASRPPEESIDRTLERERIKAYISSREAQLVQNIEFRVKYPQKVPTRVPPGVEFDKAHEERRALPDEFSDVELLGPSLFPLWRQWKESGGLLGEDGMPSENWTMYDSNDLIDSLAGREDFLYGHIGPRALRRLMDMRGLVEREKQMFLNKERMVLTLAEQYGADDEDEDGSDYGSAGAKSPSAHGSARKSRRSGPTVDHTNRGRIVTGKYTKVRPFHLSKGPTSEQRLKLMDTQHLLGDMKRNFEQHLKTLHELKKEQLQRELDRATGGDSGNDAE